MAASVGSREMAEFFTYKLKRYECRCEKYITYA